MKKEPLFVGLDVGGTTMKAVVADDSGKLLSKPVSLDTRPELGQDQGLKTMAQTIRKAVAAAKLTLTDIAAIGVATPGSMDIAAGIILDPPNLKPWQNVPVRKYIASEFGLPTAFQNDANAAAYGEFWRGAGRKYSSMVLFTLGTGVGGGIILNESVLEGEHSHGAELGHIKIEMTNPRACGCGKRGCLEAYASATAVVERTREALQSSPSRSTLKNEPELTAEKVFQAADEGDKLAGQIVDDTARYLAIAAANLMHVIDPKVIAFAGGMTAAGKPFLNRIRELVHEYAFEAPAQKCEIRYAKLGSKAGVIGAAGCARLLWKKGKKL